MKAVDEGTQWDLVYPYTAQGHVNSATACMSEVRIPHVTPAAHASRAPRRDQTLLASCATMACAQAFRWRVRPTKLLQRSEHRVYYVYEFASSGLVALPWKLLSCATSDHPQLFGAAGPIRSLTVGRPARLCGRVVRCTCDGVLRVLDRAGVRATTLVCLFDCVFSRATPRVFASERPQELGKGEAPQRQPWQQLCLHTKRLLECSSGSSFDQCSHALGTKMKCRRHASECIDLASTCDLVMLVLVYFRL